MHTISVEDQAVSSICFCEHANIIDRMVTDDECRIAVTDDNRTHNANIHMYLYPFDFSKALYHLRVYVFIWNHMFIEMKPSHETAGEHENGRNVE